MDAAASAAVAAIAAAVSAIVTLCIALTEVRAADFNNCLDVVTKLGDAQRRVRDAKNDSRVRDFELRELLNLMEALALLENNKRLGRSTRKFVEHFLEEAWAFLRADASMWAFIEKCITGADTFAELVKFSKKRSGRIEALTNFYRQQLLDRSP